MFTTRVCLSQKSQKNENGWGKGENNFPLERISRNPSLGLAIKVKGFARVQAKRETRECGKV